MSLAIVPKWSLPVMAAALVALFAAPPASADGDFCELVDGLLVCDGGDGTPADPGASDQGHHPEDLAPQTGPVAAGPLVTPQAVRTSELPAGHSAGGDVGALDHQNPHQPTSQYLGNDTCRYWGTRYADGNHGGDGTYGVDNSMGMYARANANQPFLPGTNNSFAWSRGGVQLTLPADWPQPSSITVTYPWNTTGQVDVNSDPEASAEAGHQTSMQFWRGSELAGNTVVLSESVNTGFGPRTRNVNESGTTSLTVSSPGNIFYTSLGVNSTTASATGASITFTSARGTSLFFGPGLHVWVNHMDWRFNLPSGWTIASCE